MPAGDNAYWSDVANLVNKPLVRLVQQAADTFTTAVTRSLSFGAGGLRDHQGSL